jgi:hypothetical protein
LRHTFVFIPPLAAAVEGDLSVSPKATIDMRDKDRTPELHESLHFGTDQRADRRNPIAGGSN